MVSTSREVSLSLTLVPGKGTYSMKLLVGEGITMEKDGKLRMFSIVMLIALNRSGLYIIYIAEMMKLLTCRGVAVI